MMPNGWHTTKMGSVFKSRREKGRAGLPTLSVTLYDGLVPRDSLERKTDTNLSADKHLLVRPGDIAYNMMRMWQGASGLSAVEAIVSPAYVVLEPKSTIDPTFAAYLFKLPRTVHNLWAYSYGLTNDRLRLYFGDFSMVPLGLPPLAEQARIAQILTTWDQAISATEKLIAIGQAQKTALLRQLLNRERRLPGFDGDWKTVSVRNLGSVSSGGTPDSTKPEYWDGEILWATPTDITGLPTAYISNTNRKITKAGLKASSAKLLPAGSILLCTRATVGEVALAKKPISTNQGFKNLIPNDSYDARFLYFLFVANKKLFVRYSCGSTFLELSKKDLEKLKFSVPGLKEQKIIAEVLSTADSNVEILVQKLEKLQREKHALMQQLLTGKRRVKVEEADAA